MRLVIVTTNLSIVSGLNNKHMKQKHLGYRHIPIIPFMHMLSHMSFSFSSRLQQHLVWPELNITEDNEDKTTL